MPDDDATPPLVYLGSVGSGFTDTQLDDVLSALEEIEVDASPCTRGPVPKGRGHHWVSPELVVEVRYKEVVGAAGQAAHPQRLPEERVAADGQRRAEGADDLPGA